MKVCLRRLIVEHPDSVSTEVDTLSIFQMLSVIYQADQKLALAVGAMPRTATSFITP